MTPSGKLPSDSARDKGDDTSGLVRLIEAALYKHAADEAGRVSSTRTILAAAIALHAEYVPLGDVAIAASETIAALAPRHRWQAGRG